MPSGNYGADALTDRVKGPQSGISPPPMADEKPYDFDRSKLPGSRYPDDYAGIEPDEETRKTFHDWLQVAGSGLGPRPASLLESQKSALFDALWRRDGGPRVASRFYLQTLIQIYDFNKDGTLGAKRGKPMESRRVPLDMEVVIENPTPQVSRQRHAGTGDIPSTDIRVASDARSAATGHRPGARQRRLRALRRAADRHAPRCAGAQ